MSEPTTPEATPTAPPVPAPAPVASAETFDRTYVESLRSEAAKYRTEKNDAVSTAKAAADVEWQAKLDAATTTHTATQDELSKSQLTLLKLTKVLEADIPSDSALAIAELVKGEDEASVSESVKTVKALLGKNPPKASAVDPSQGSGSGPIPLNGDAVLDALTAIVGAPRR